MLAPCNRQQGFTLLGLLFLVAAMGVGMAAVGTLWHTHAQREKEKQLLFVGDQYRRALESYWNATPDGQKKSPATLDELVLDTRFTHTVRHLRKKYTDPITGANEWGLIRAQGGGISGVYSLSGNAPFKTAGFPESYEQFNNSGSYRDWRFVHTGNGDAVDKRDIARSSVSNARSAPPRNKQQTSVEPSE